MNLTTKSQAVGLYFSPVALLALCAWAPSAIAQDAHYVYPNGTKIPMIRSKSEFGVIFRDGADLQRCSSRLAAERCGVVESLPGDPDGRVRILRAADTSITRRNRVRLDPDIEEVRPIYRFADEEVPVITTGQFLVKVRRHLTEAERAQLWSDFDAVVIRPVEGMPDVYLVQPRDVEHDELLRAQLLAEDSRTLWSQPNLRRPAKVRQVTPTDTHFPLQWHLNNTGQTGGTPDADIDALEAWTLSEGQDILIGAFDDACDVEHEDLRENYIGKGHDPTLESDNPGFNDPNPKQINDNHGTAVLGLAVARANSRGVRGVAHLAEFTLSRGVTNTILTDLDRASVFTFARQEEVDVHLNSWGSTLGGVRNSTVVVEAIKLAFDEGRSVTIEEDGQRFEVELGMVIVWAAGNEFKENVSGFDYSTVPEVIGVGASTHTDEQAIYSNYGPNIDMLAPGGEGPSDLLVTTDNTDRPSAVDNGYNVGGSELDDAGLYTNSFSGTSASCPVAAGVAALVLSMNSRLFASEVRLIMEHTCDAVNPDIAQYNPTTSRSVRYGYGRINAFNAVRAAQQTLTNGGVSWPGRVFNVRVSDGKLRWQASDGTDEFLVVESDSPFGFAAKDMQCYDRTQLGCGSVTATPLPSGVRIALVNACDGDECNVGKDQSIDIDTTTGPKYWGIFARNLIGRYSWGVAADSLGTVTDPGPVRGDATEDGDGGDIPGTVEGPKVTISVTPLEGDSPLRVRFMGNAVSVFAIDESKTEWDFDIDSRDDPVAKTRNAEYVYTVPAGESQDFTARLTMVDVQNNIGSASVMIRVRGPETDGSGSPIGESSLRILVGVPGNPTADESSGKSPFAVELSVDASSLQGTLQSIVWDLGDGTSPRPTSLVVPHTYVNTSNADLVIPITVTATTVTSGSVSIRTSATRLITVEPGTGSIGPGPMPPDGGDGGDGGSNTCGALGLFPLLGIFGTMMGFRRMRT